MKIHPDQLEGVRPDQQNRVDRTRQNQQGFGDMLSREISRGDESQQAAPAAPLPGLTAVNPLIGIQPMQGEAQAAQSVSARVETMLGQVEGYAGILADRANPQSLRQANEALDALDQEVQAVKEEFPDMASANPELNSLVNELEILSTTERFKFNRGDYL